MFLPRSRSRTATSATQRVSYSHKSRNADPWPAPYTYGSIQSYDGETGSISDQPHPGYQRQINRGNLVFGDCTISQWTRTHTDALCYYGPYGKPEPDGWGYEKLWGDMAGWVEGRVSDYSSFSSLLSSMKTVAVIEAHAKMNESALLTGEFLSDFGKTISMLRRPFKSSLSLLNSMVKYKNKRLGKTTRSALKASSDAWLEYRYGWKPIILDSYTAAEAASNFTSRLSRRRLVARAAVPMDQTVTNRQRVAGGLPRLSGADVDGTYHSSGGAFAGVIYDVRSKTSSEELLAILGMRPQDLPATLWEITPWSFVADWFGNFGPWLRAVTPNPDVTVRGSWVTTVQRRTISLKLSGYVTLGPSAPYPEVTFSNLPCGGSERTIFEFTREVNPAIQPPVLKATPLSTPQIVDALSLTVGQILSNLGRLRH